MNVLAKIVGYIIAVMIVIVTGLWCALMWPFVHLIKSSVNEDMD